MLYLFFPSGGLSNQIIQTSFLMSLIKKKDIVILCTDSFNINNGYYIKSRKFSKNISSWLKYKNENKEFYLIFSSLNILFSKLRYKLITNKLTIKIFAIFKIKIIAGYYQDFKSLDSSQIYIYDFLNFSSQSYKFFKKNKSALAIHIRLGDYLKMNKNLSKNYYLNSIDKIINNYFISDINIFTDSPECVFKIYPELLKLSIPISINSNKDELLDLINLSKYDFLIASASSFSWIASYFGKHKKVVVPKDFWLPIDKNYFIK